MEVLLTIAVTAISVITAYSLGLNAGRAIMKGKEIKIAPENPLNAIKKQRAKAGEALNMNVMFDNIDNYDGTSLGQKKLN